MPFLRSGFRLGNLPLRPNWWSAAEMVVLLEGFPISRVTLELCQSDHWFLGHLPDQGPSPLIGGSNLLLFKNSHSTPVLITKL